MQRRFLTGLEVECQTFGAREGTRESVQSTSLAFLEEISRLCPSLRGETGVFLPYGKVLVDCDHVELATCEADSPEGLVRVLESLMELSRRACRKLAAAGTPLRLANNNHAGVLKGDAPSWGTHENIATPTDPVQLEALALPFLVTRLYAGAGGVLHPTGAYVAGVRPYLMKRASGGDTTRQRAIHSTCRRESLGGRSVGLHRYHLLVGDGKRCQYGVALTAGATMLAVAAMVHDRELAANVAAVMPKPIGRSWCRTIQAFHRLAGPGRPLRVRSEVIDVQEVYLEAARRFVARLGESAPAWTWVTLRRWADTLRAFRTGDLDWLRERLDPFAKHELFAATLGARGVRLSNVRGNDDSFARLSLIDHSWHEFTDDESAFAEWDARGMLNHRVVDSLDPGDESDPWIPAVETRARPRARFLVENASKKRHIMSWTRATDRRTGATWPLLDPFATSYGPEEALPPDETPGGIDRLLDRLRRRMEAGEDEPPF